MSDPISDAEIVAATFRNVSDADAFDDMLAAWGRRLEAQLAEGKFADLSEEMRGHVEQALEQMRRNLAGPVGDTIDHVIDIPAPAMVLSPTGVVVAANHAGADAFGALQGRAVTLDWLDDRSHATFQDMLRSASSQSNRQQAVLRLIAPDHTGGMAEIFHISPDQGRTNLVAIRSLEVEWSQRTDAILGEAFDLTEAECQVARALFHTRDTAEIAQQRGASVHTVRAQIKSIQAKTEVSSQVDLVRLLILLAQRNRDEETADGSAWRDPWGNEAIVEGPGGMRIGYSWTGDPKGKPVLIVHNVLHGYAFPEHVEQRLARAGIRLIAIQRLGFGNSTAPVFDRQTHLDSLKFLIEKLELTDVVAVQLGGVLGIVRSAIRDPHLYKSILLAGMAPPYTREVRAMMPKSALAIVLACRKSPLLGRLMIETAMRNARRKGMDWLVERLFVTAPADLASLHDPDIRPILRNAFELSVSADPAALLWMYQTHMEDYDLDMEALTVPVHALASANLSYYHAPSMEQFAQRSDHFTYEPIPGGGLRLIYQKADLIADRIIAAVHA